MIFLPNIMDRTIVDFPLKLFEYIKKLRFDNTPYAFLKYHQNVVRDYLNNVSFGGNGILVYQTPGMGKTIEAAAIAIDLIGKGYDPIVLLTKSLQENFRGGIAKYIKMRTETDPAFNVADVNEWINSRFSFVSMNASNMIAQLQSAAETSQEKEYKQILRRRSLDKKLGQLISSVNLEGKTLIVDEAHNLFRAITNGSKNGLEFYNIVMKTKNIRLVFLTGTPIANDPFELVPCFNMLAGKQLFPDSWGEFYKLFVNDDKSSIKNREKFQNRIMGLISYVSYKSTPGKGTGAEIDVEGSRVEFPEMLPIIVRYLPMTTRQFSYYRLAREKESAENKRNVGREFEVPAMQKPKGKSASSYKQRSRQISNICPPNKYLDGKFSEIPVETFGEADLADSPKLNELIAITERHKRIGYVYSQFVSAGGLASIARKLILAGWEIHPIQKSRKFTKAEESSEEVAGGGDEDYFDYLHRAAGSAEMKVVEISPSEEMPHFGEPGFKYYKCGETIMIVFVAGGETIFSQFCGEEDSAAMRVLLEHLVKITRRISHITASPAIREIMPAEFVALDDEHYYYVKSTHGGDAPRKFAIISGEVDTAERQAIQDLYNSEENKFGGVIDLLLISSTGAEGLDLKNTEYEIIFEPYWSYFRLNQIYYRGIRNDSHKTMPADQKKVQIYVLLSVRPDDADKDFAAPTPEMMTTDLELYFDALRDYKLIESFLEPMQKASIECLANAEENCRVCNPTGKKFFSDDIFADIKISDPCETKVERKIKAEEIEFGGEKYYYAADSQNVFGYKIYKYDAGVAKYVPLNIADPIYEDIIAAIEKK